MNFSTSCFCGNKLPPDLCCFKKYKSLQTDPNFNITVANQYELWASARKSLHLVLSKEIKEIPQEHLKNIIILGAGACEDLPIDYICDIFEEVVLVDIDGEALLKSKQYIPLKLQNKVTYVEMDLTGIWDQFTYQIFTGQITSYDDGINYLNNISKNLDNLKFPAQITQKMPFSFVVSDLILTQLPSRLLAFLSSSLGIPYTPTTNDGPLSFIEALTVNHVNLLHSLCSSYGKIMVLSDIFTFGIEIDGSKPLFNQVLIDYGPSALDGSLPIDQSIINEWLSKYPCTSGGNIIPVITKYHQDKFIYEKTYYWWWIFSKKRRYFIVCNLFSI